VRGYGHVRDGVDGRDRHLGNILRGADPLGSLPASTDLSRFVDSVQDQGPTSSCVGQAIASAAHVVARASGLRIARPSALAIYAQARLVDAPGVPLIDLGCSPRSAFRACSRFGLVASSRWPLDFAAVDMEPPLDIYQAGADARISGYYRADAGDRAALLRAAIVQGHVPIFGMPVDARYEGLDDDTVYQGPTGDVHGLHAQAIVGYEGEAFRVLNSWGTAWGDGGFSWIDAAFIASDACFDRWIVTLAPPEVS
jgi:hypothetical protein